MFSIIFSLIRGIKLQPAFRKVSLIWVIFWNKGINKDCWNDIMEFGIIIYIIGKAKMTILR